MTLGPNAPEVEKFHFLSPRSKSNVLVVAGVHGSERAGIEVARRLITSFGKVRPVRHSVTIVPVLFPVSYALAVESFAKRQGRNLPRDMRDSRTGRATIIGKKKFTDPNRQFPTIGDCLGATKKDSQGRDIELENVFLLELIEKLSPVRIISIHSIAWPRRTITVKDLGKINLPGVFVDPQTNLAVTVTQTNPLTKPAHTTDDDLALKAAKAIKKDYDEAIKKRLVKSHYKDEFDKWVSGNWLDSKSPTTRYARAKPTQFGHSLGEWGPRAVAAKTCAKAARRKGIPIFTFEVRRYYTSTDYLSLYKAGRTNAEKIHNKKLKAEHNERILELNADAMAVRSVLIDEIP